ncbi:MAG: hypothetical protein GXO93_01790 [FCB group bacterium]|nr:hypothetical protein [FCB group bacterium]
MIKEKKLLLYSSVGTPNWELVTALASLNEIKLKLIIPIQNDNKWDSTKKNIEHQFSLNSNLTEFIPLFYNGKNQFKEIMSKRDALIVEQADILIPVSIRSQGHKEIWKFS